MIDLSQYQGLLATDVADAQSAGFAMDIGIQSVWKPVPRLMGFAYTVSCRERSNTYFHSAIYKAPKNAIIVAEVDTNDYAVAGGNVCAVAKRNGIQGFIIDGVIRDLGEVRDIAFPVFARGVFPKPGEKTNAGASEIEIQCGGVAVSTGDLIVADEEGIVVVPASEVEQVMTLAVNKKTKAEDTSLTQWRESHFQKIRSILSDK